MSNPNLMYFRFTHSIYCVFTYLFTQWDEYGYMNYVEYSPQYTYEYHHNHNHHFIIARLCSFFLSLLHTRKSITNSKFIGFAFELSKPILLLLNECLSLVENVKLVWKRRLLSMICFDRMFGDCIDVWNRIEIGICRIVDYCSLS